MATLSTVNVKITGDTGQLVSALTVAEKRVGLFGSRVQAVSRNQAQGLGTLGRGFLTAAGQSGMLTSELSILTSSVGGVGVAGAAAAIGVGALVLGLTAAVKASINFEASFARIKKTVDGTEQEFERLAAANRQLAKELPVSVNAINEIGVIGGQLGIPIGGLVEFERTIASIATSTGLSAEEIAKAFGTLVSVLGVPITELDRVGSSLTSLGNNFNSTEGDILEFAVRFAGAAKVVGIGVADVLGISNAFASVGIEAERGGTAIQKTLLDINKAATLGGDKLTLFAAVAGLTEQAFRDLQKADPSQAFIKFVEGIGALGDQAIPVLEALDLADARLLASILSVAGGQDLLRRSIDDSTQAALENTATQNEVATQTDTTAAQFKILKNKINDTAISIGDFFNPALKYSLKLINANYDEILKAIPIVGELGTAASLLADNWRAAWNDIASVTESVINGILSAIEQMVDGIDNAIGGINGFVNNPVVRKGLGLFGRGGGADIPTFDFDAPNVSIPRAGGTGGGTGGGPFDNQIVFTPRAPEGSNPPDDDFAARIAALLAGLGSGVGSAARDALTPLEALSDGIISFGEAVQLGLTDQQIVTLELAAAAGQAEEEAYRLRIELLKLAIAFPGLNAEQVRFSLGLKAIADNLRETNRTAEQFDLAERLSPALEGLQSQFDAIFNRPTRETAGLELRLATLQRDKLLRQQAGASDESLKPIDAQISAVQLQLDIRRKEIDIIRAKNTIADASLLTDAAQATQAQLTTTALAATSQEVEKLGGVVFLQTLAQIGLTNAALAATAALNGIPSIDARALGGKVRGGMTLVGEQGPEIVSLPSGANVSTASQTRGMFSQRGESGTPSVTNIYVTADTRASEATARMIAQMVREEVEFATRRQGLGGASVNTNAFTPAGAR